ncbi:MAG TPA: CvpA family protein [Phnomibacter sp.]|nr:CvpA family protein [Phnomibacter sp.]
MFIDVLVIIAVGMALFKGYSKGLIMALFSTLGLLIGLAAAVRFSSIAAWYLSEEFDISPSYAPILAFLLVFMAATIIVRLIGKAVEKTLESIDIGFLNKVGGITLYLFLYLAVASVLVYYLEKTGILDDDLVQQSVTYHWIAPWGPMILDGLGLIIPWFRDMFDELNRFFDKVVE